LRLAGYIALGQTVALHAVLLLLLGPDGASPLGVVRHLLAFGVLDGLTLVAATLAGDWFPQRPRTRYHAPGSCSRPAAAVLATVVLGQLAQELLLQLSPPGDVGEEDEQATGRGDHRHRVPAPATRGAILEGPRVTVRKRIVERALKGGSP